MRRTLLIEGLPYAWGEVLPSWSTHKLASCLALERPEITESLDPLGGIQITEGAKFRLVDTGDGYEEDGLKVAKMLRMYNPAPVYITDPAVLTHNYSPGNVVTLNTDNHPVALAWFANGSDYAQVAKSKYFDNIYKDWTFEFWVKDSLTTESVYVAHGAQMSISQVGGFIEVFTNDGSAHTFTGTNALTADKWTHVVVTFGDGDCTIYTDLVDETAALDYPTQVIDTNLEWFREAYDCSFARCAFWLRKLTAAEVAERFYGRYVDSSELYTEYDMRPYNGRNLHDQSGKGLHSSALVSDWQTRQWLPGDLLYLPTGSARISSRTGSGTYQIQPGAYSCTQYPWQQFNATVYPNDYTAEVSTECAPYLLGRLIAYYENKKLRYLGRIEDIQQNGRSWDISTQHVLKPLIDGLKPASLLLQQASDWVVSLNNSGFRYGAKYTSGFTVGSLSGVVETGVIIGGYTVAELAAALQAGITDDYWSFSASDGYVMQYDDLVSATVENTISTVLKGFFDNYPNIIQSEATGVFKSFQDGRYLKAYGAMLQPGITIPLDSAQGSWITDTARLSWADHNGVEYYSDIADSNPTLGTVTLGYIYKKSDDQRVDGCYIEQDSPITYQITPLVKASSLEALIYGLLTSTGDGGNGSYDDFAGTVGLGLPEEYLNTDYISEWDTTAVVWDTDKGKLTDDLQALGLALVFRGEQFRIIRVRPPQLAQATSAVVDSDVQPGDMSQAAWGYHRPMSSISYEKNNVVIKVNAVAANIWDSAQSRAKEYKGAARFGLHNLDDWAYLQAQRLRWFTHYSPTIRCKKINHGLQLGDIVTVTAKKLAGWGRYGRDNIPAIVTRLSGDYGFDLLLNTDPLSLAAIWVPSWEIESYSGTTLTLRHSEGLRIEDVVDLPATMQIIELDSGTALGSVTVTAATATTVTVSVAPSYTYTTDLGVLTLRDYTAEGAKIRQYYTWAGASDVMSNGDEAKKLL